ncbi:MAG: hypothetical protein ACOX9C_13215 [Kiritimatiellia bacterium]|jgi:hypothetical protein
MEGQRMDDWWGAKRAFHKSRTSRIPMSRPTGLNCGRQQDSALALRMLVSAIRLKRRSPAKAVALDLGFCPFVVRTLFLVLFHDVAVIIESFNLGEWHVINFW